MTIGERLYFTFVYEERYRFFLNGLGNTLILTLASFILGTLLAVVFCTLKNSKNKVVSSVTKAFCSLMVQLPTLVLLMVFVYILFGEAGLSILLVVSFALILKASAYLAEIFDTAVNTVNPGEIEAARTLGMTKSQAFFNVVLPQAVTAAKPLYKNQFINTMQETSTVGYLAVVDLTRASSIVTSRTLDALFGLIMISIIYLVIGYIGQVLIGLIGKHKHLGGRAQ